MGKGRKRKKRKPANRSKNNAKSAKKSQAVPRGLIFVSLCLVLLCFGGNKHREQQSFSSSQASTDGVTISNGRIAPSIGRRVRIPLPVEPEAFRGKLKLQGQWNESGARALAASLQFLREVLPSVDLAGIDVSTGDVRALSRRMEEVTFKKLWPGHPKYKTNLALFDVSDQSIHVKPSLLVSHFMELTVELAHELMHSVKDNHAVSGSESEIIRVKCAIEIRTHAFGLRVAQAVEREIKRQRTHVSGTAYKFWLADVAVAKERAKQLMVFYKVRRDLLQLHSILGRLYNRVARGGFNRRFGGFPGAAPQMQGRLHEIRSLQRSVASCLQAASVMETRDAQLAYSRFYTLVITMIDPRDFASFELTRPYHDWSSRVEELDKRDKLVVEAIRKRNQVGR